MPTYHYNAVDASGAVRSGELTAASHAEAVGSLESRGWRVGEVAPLLTDEERNTAVEPVFGDAPPARSEGDAVEVVGRVADLARSGLPLASGLRALSAETPSRRVRRALVEVSDRIEGGESLEQALTHPGASVPPHLAGLIRAGARSGRLPEILEEYLEHARNATDRRKQAVTAFVYPSILFMVAGGVFTFFLVYLVPMFKKVFEDFGTELPGITQALITLSDFLYFNGVWIVLGLVVPAVALSIATGLSRREASMRRLLTMIPIVGPLVRYLALARLCRLLAIFVEQQVALPEALRLAGNGSGDSYLNAGCERLAEAVERGAPPAAVALETRELPPQLGQSFRWAENRESFSSMLDSTGRIYESRAVVQAGLLEMVAEPLTVVGIAIFIATVVLALFMPLVKLLNDLS